MRSKEEAHDYRYFPDPDLLPLEISEAWIAEVRATLPELPQVKRARFEKDYGLSGYDAAVLTASKEIAEYFEAVVRALGGEPKLCANWVMGDLSAALNKEELDVGASRIGASDLAGLLKRIHDGTISSKIAKDVFAAMWAGEGSADAVIDAKGLKQISDSSEIEKIVDEIIAANPGQVADYRSGKDKLFAFFVGQAMKATKGKANPTQLSDILKSKLAG
jgi:aspartyl-tRNA(Asn)/glutamyl-tRNA(Gln) amidotransferase subunit B